MAALLTVQFVQLLPSEAESATKSRLIDDGGETSSVSRRRYRQRTASARRCCSIMRNTRTLRLRKRGYGRPKESISIHLMYSETRQLSIVAEHEIRPLNPFFEEPFVNDRTVRPCLSRFF